MMRNNLISQLNSHSIPIYGNVKVLDLSENKIKKLDGLSSLKYSLQILNIQKNEIETLNDMSQVLELEQLTNIDFRGNPIQSLEEENLIFEEILEKCNNVWFINGATTLASPLVEEDENHHFEKNEYSIMMEFEENSNSFKNQSCCGHVSSLTPMHVHDFEENRELQSISSSSIPPPPRKSQQHQQQHTPIFPPHLLTIIWNSTMMKRREWQQKNF
ncbi:hypothetical protein C9374_002716 [Naegleria lovaniensis]|uniref:Uncharacterized protein n=1 Tax=Naegleria lovaniensis TaxID=51637 RepID=A0AA88GNZ4_NAELO|nr:uncharacterized protein C9374_002716 [Naegleria lovaniensis]KAG2386270.1 hypothetical protein C9374_002716 [Naegleria lovaniensis]